MTEVKEFIEIKIEPKDEMVAREENNVNEAQDGEVSQPPSTQAQEGVAQMVASFNLAQLPSQVAQTPTTELAQPPSAEVNFVNVKPEIDNIVVKLEPFIPDDDDEDEDYKEIPVEDIKIKMEPYYENDEEYEADLQRGVARDDDSDYEDEEEQDDNSDEDYMPKKKKKKKQESNIKPGVIGKPKTRESKYSEEILKLIQIVTIDENDRRLEHHELYNSRKHMNYTCEPCALGFVIEEAYNVHMKVHSPENGEHVCDICKSCMKTADILYRHRLRHYRRYRCGLCGARQRDKDTVAAHIMREHMGMSFLCAHCGRGFKRPQYLKRHVEQMHTRPHRLECPVCGRVFFERGWYRCHVRTHNQEVRNRTEVKAECGQCGREFRNKQYLVRHLRTHEQRRVDCAYCLRSFKNPAALRVHFKKHHRGHREPVFNEETQTYSHPAPVNIEDFVQRNTKCMQCGRMLSTRAMLQRHVQRMHSDRLKQFQCDYCKRSYYTKAEVRAHIEWSHLERRVHACGCGRVFRTPARLRQHACPLRPAAAPPPRDKPCPVCGKMFANQQVLTRHIKGHSGEMFPCAECGQTFKTQSYVKVHYKIKHLNMTRAQIKAQSKRQLIMVNNGNEVMNAKVRRKNLGNADPLNMDNEQIVEVKKEMPDIAVPLFETFVEIQREY